MPERRVAAWPRGMSAPVAAEYLGLSETAFRALVAAGDAPAGVRYPCRRDVWLREDLDAWLDRLAGKAAASGKINPWDAADGIGRAAIS